MAAVLLDFFHSLANIPQGVLVFDSDFVKFGQLVAGHKTSSLVVHLHLDEVLYKVVDSVVGLVLLEFIFQLQELKGYFFEVLERGGTFDLFLNLHEGILPVHVDVLSSNLGPVLVMVFYHASTVDPVDLVMGVVLKDHAKKTHSDPLVIYHLTFHGCLDANATAKVVSSCEEFAVGVEVEHHVYGGLAGELRVELVQDASLGLLHLFLILVTIVFHFL